MNEPIEDAQFVVTKQYRRFAEFCDACRHYRYIGLCYGPPGVGKTLSARHYAQWDFAEPFVHNSLRSVPPIEVVPCHTVVYTPPVHNTPRLIADEVTNLSSGLDWAVDRALKPEEMYNFTRERAKRTQLILVDEADRLKMPGLEQMRDIYDRQKVGLILIGMPGLEKRLARYAQLYSRVGFVHQFFPLSADEVVFILDHKWKELGLSLSPTDFTDAEAVAAITRVTGGNFRLLQRLFTQIERVLKINDLQVITKEVVDAARESLVIGPL